MADFLTMPPDDILQFLVDAGSINTEAVQTLEKYLESDWIISADEAELLFRVNRSVGEREENCPSWNDLYVRSISRYVLFDMNSPGEICPDEAEWLRSHIAADEGMSKSDRELLRYIHSHATSCCDSMQPLFQAAGM
ncbi:hypothetical protein SH139x_000754 [Planctomycetaceae bacterium SH139]